LSGAAPLALVVIPTLDAGPVLRRRSPRSAPGRRRVDLSSRQREPGRDGSRWREFGARAPHRARPSAGHTQRGRGPREVRRLPDAGRTARSDAGSRLVGARSRAARRLQRVCRARAARRWSTNVRNDLVFSPARRVKRRARRSAPRPSSSASSSPAASRRCAATVRACPSRAPFGEDLAWRARVAAGGRRLRAALGRHRSESWRPPRARHVAAPATCAALRLQSAQASRRLPVVPRGQPLLRHRRSSRPGGEDPRPTTRRLPSPSRTLAAVIDAINPSRLPPVVAQPLVRARRPRRPDRQKTCRPQPMHRDRATYKGQPNRPEGQAPSLETPFPLHPRLEPRAVGVLDGVGNQTATRLPRQDDGAALLQPVAAHARLVRGGPQPLRRPRDDGAAGARRLRLRASRGRRDGRPHAGAREGGRAGPVALRARDRHPEVRPRHDRRDDRAGHRHVEGAARRRIPAAPSRATRPFRWSTSRATSSTRARSSPTA
jgi:hypothetical protein